MEGSNGIIRGRLDIARCFNDAVEVYKINFFPLVFSFILLEIITVFTLFIMAGPIGGGYYKMLLNAMNREDKKVDIGDMFRALDKFWPLAGLFFITAICYIITFIFLVIPSLLLMTMWLYAFLVMVDKEQGVFSSLRASWNVVFRKGFGVNLMLYILYLAIIGGTSWIPYIGWLLSWFLGPVGYLILTSAYIQQVREDEGELSG